MSSISPPEQKGACGESDVEMMSAGDPKEILPGHPDFQSAERIRKSVICSINDPIRTFGVMKSKRRAEFRETGSFEFRDYLPAEFHEIRIIAGISDDEYALEFSKDLVEFSVNSKGGMRMYKTGNGRFLIKWMSQQESKVLRNMVPVYLSHLKKYPRSLLNKCFGLHRVDSGKRRCHCVRPENENIYFQILENTFWQCPLPPDLIYDLKGSIAGRRSNPGDTILKDLDFLDESTGARKLHLGSSLGPIFLEQVRVDASLLQEMGVMDHSLLVGISSSPRLRGNEIDDPDVGWPSHDGKCVYYLGIIDILQCWTIKKKSAGCFKQYCGCNEQNTLSTVPPDHYARRFVSFISTIVE